MNAIRALQVMNEQGVICPTCKVKVQTLYASTRLRPSPDGFRTIVRCQFCYDEKKGE